MEANHLGFIRAMSTYGRYSKVSFREHRKQSLHTVEHTMARATTKLLNCLKSKAVYEFSFVL
jgi:hypothetical protein